MKSNRVLLILNPKSGKCKGEKRLGDILRILESGGYLSTVMLTEKAGDARQFVLDHGENYDLVVSVGGDGTFSEVVSGMVSGNYNKPIGYIPAGSANDYGKNLGLSSDLGCAAENIIYGKPAFFDVGCCNGSPFAYVAAFGPFAQISYSAPQNLKNSLGHFAYILEGIWNLPNIHPEHAWIEVDGERFEGDYILGVISNATSIGGILQFSPNDVSLNDGYLEMMLVSMPSSPKDFARVVQAISTRAYMDCEGIVFCRGKEIRIRADSPMAWTLDGEYAQSCAEVEISNLPNAIQVIVPAADE